MVLHCGDIVGSRQVSGSGQSSLRNVYAISDIKDADGLHVYNMAVKFAEKVEKASVSPKDKTLLMAAFVDGNLDRQVTQASPVLQWPVLVKARATEQAAEVARTAAEARQPAALQQQKALEQRARLADQDAKERDIFTAAARVWHSELAGQASMEVEKAKATLQAGKAARSVMVSQTSAKAMVYDAGLRNGQFPQQVLAIQSLYKKSFIDEYFFFNVVFVFFGIFLALPCFQFALTSPQSSDNFPP